MSRYCLQCLSLHANPIGSPGSCSIAIPLREVVDRKAVLLSQFINTLAGSDKLKALAAVDDVWHDRDRSLLWGVVCSEVGLDRWRELVPRRVDADRDVGLETEASLTDVRVPFVELRDGEIVVRLGDRQASVGWLDGVEGCAV